MTHSVSETDQAHFLKIWSGLDPHIGIYKPKESSIPAASANTLKKMLRLMPTPKKSTRILVLGAGYGTAALHLVNTFGCKVDAISQSQTQHTYLQAQIEAQELQKKLFQQKGKAGELPFDRETFDLVWAQEYLWSYPKKRKAFKEIQRVLKAKGRLVCTDIFLSEDCDEATLTAAQANLPLKELVTLPTYERTAKRALLQRIYTSEMSEQLVLHHQAMLNKFESEEAALAKATKPGFIKAQIERHRQWLTLAEAGCLEWGILMLQKMNN